MRKMRGLSVQSGRWVLVSFALLAIPGALAFLHGCSSGGGSHKKGKVLKTIEVTPASPSLAKGTSLQLTATGIFADKSKQDLTASVVWSSSDTNVAGVGVNTGLVNGALAGTVTIVATKGAVSGSQTLTVTNAALVSIDVTPALPNIAKGTTQQFTATGLFTDATTQDLTTSATWSSSNAAVATVSNAAGSEGLGTGVDPGTSSITAAFGLVSGSTTLTVTAATLVSIDVTPASPSIAKGTTQQFTATGVFTDATTQDLTTSVSWASSDTAVATISNTAGTEGLATSAAMGSTTVTATSGAVSGSTTLTVTAATLVSIDVTPASPGIAKGTTQQFTATGVYTDASTQDITTAVTWSSSDTAVATISNAGGSEGLSTSAAMGSTTVTATSGAVSGSTTLTVTAATLVSIDVTPALPDIAKGTTQQFTATGTYTDASTQDLTTAVTWSSSDTAVATISNAAGSEG
ncbi:MAG TPA: Ig-like domain-containing protein, partial [Planctomycetota bacterium]|nr:Ig-like domain-containing protein [Planctomycetota bacterium]